MIFILSSISSGLEFSSVKCTSIYENSELRVFKNIFKLLGEISSNWPNDLLEQMYTRLLNFVDNLC